MTTNIKEPVLVYRDFSVYVNDEGFFWVNNDGDNMRAKTLIDLKKKIDALLKKQFKAIDVYHNQNGFSHDDEDRFQVIGTAISINASGMIKVKLPKFGFQKCPAYTLFPVTAENTSRIKEIHILRKRVLEDEQKIREIQASMVSMKQLLNEKEDE